MLASDGSPNPVQHPYDLIAAISQGPPVLLSLAESSVQFVHGQPTRLTVNAQRLGGFNEAVTVTSVGQPGGVGGGTTTIPANANQGCIDYTVDPNTPIVAASISFTANTNYQGRREDIALPPIPAQVLRPYAFELLTPAVSLSQGGKATVVGVLKRTPPFNGEVRFASVGSVPPNVQIPNVALPPGGSLVQIEMSTEQTHPWATTRSCSGPQAILPAASKTKTI